MSIKTYNSKLNHGFNKQNAIILTLSLSKYRTFAFEIVLQDGGRVLIKQVRYEKD